MFGEYGNEARSSLAPACSLALAAGRCPLVPCPLHPASTIATPISQATGAASHAILRSSDLNKAGPKMAVCSHVLGEPFRHVLLLTEQHTQCGASVYDAHSATMAHTIYEIITIYLRDVLMALIRCLFLKKIRYYVNTSASYAQYSCSTIRKPSWKLILILPVLEL